MVNKDKRLFQDNKYFTLTENGSAMYFQLNMVLNAITEGK